jgi:hypothetical protein
MHTHTHTHDTRRNNKQAKWSERCKKALAEGKRAPKRPRESKVLHSAINLKDCGL